MMAPSPHFPQTKNVWVQQKKIRRYLGQVTLRLETYLPEGLGDEEAFCHLPRLPRFINKD